LRLKEERAMLVYQGFEREKIEALNVGDFFVDSTIVSMKKKDSVIMIVTESGSVYTAHIKSRTTCNVFKKNPHWTPGTKRWKQRTEDR
jgi:hypothetical protein